MRPRRTGCRAAGSRCHRRRRSRGASPRRCRACASGRLRLWLPPGGDPRMADEKSLKDLTVWSGHREISVEEIAVIQPGLGRIMPDIGTRTWKLFYAAKAG